MLPSLIWSQHLTSLDPTTTTPSFCCHARPILGGKDFGVTSTMNLSVDLMNATHYNASDASVSFVIWTEISPNTTEGWYFVLPNVLIKKNGHTYMGLCIRLFHGVSIMWDGRIIRHGASIHSTTPNSDGTPNYTMGWFWGTNTKIILTSRNGGDNNAINDV